MISIEHVEFKATKERIQETYVITNLTLSKLLKEVLSEIEKDILPLLNIEILLYTLKSVPFSNEAVGISILENLNDSMKYQLYGKSGEWNCKAIAYRLQKLRNLILYDYMIEGSLIVYRTNQIEWDLNVLILLQGK